MSTPPDANDFKVGHVFRSKLGKEFVVYEGRDGMHKWKRLYSNATSRTPPTKDPSDFKEGHREWWKGGYYTVMKSTDGNTKKWYKVSNSTKKNSVEKKKEKNEKKARHDYLNSLDYMLGDASKFTEGHRITRSAGGYYVVMFSTDGKTKKWYEITDVKRKPRRKRRSSSNPKTKKKTTTRKRSSSSSKPKTKKKTTTRKTRSSSSKPKPKKKTKTTRKIRSSSKTKTTVKRTTNKKKNGTIVRKTTIKKTTTRE